MKAKNKTHKEEKNSSPDWNGITHKAISMQQPSSWHVNLHAAVSMNAVCIFFEPPATFLYCFRSMGIKTKRKKNIFFFKQKRATEMKHAVYALYCIDPEKLNEEKWTENQARYTTIYIHKHIYWERESRLNILLLLWIKRKEMNEIFERKSSDYDNTERNNNSATTTTTIMPTIAMKI